MGLAASLKALATGGDVGLDHAQRKYILDKLSPEDAEWTQARCLYLGTSELGHAAAEAVPMERAAIPDKLAGTVRVVAVSDTHEAHRMLGTLPAGDVFIHWCDRPFLQAPDALIPAPHLRWDLCWDGNG